MLHMKDRYENRHWRCARTRVSLTARTRGAEKKEEEVEEGLFKANAVNEEDPEREEEEEEEEEEERKRRRRRRV